MGPEPQPLRNRKEGPYEVSRNLRPSSGDGIQTWGVWEKEWESTWLRALLSQCSQSSHILVPGSWEQCGLGLLQGDSEEQVYCSLLVTMITVLIPFIKHYVYFIYYMFTYHSTSSFISNERIDILGS